MIRTIGLAIALIGVAATSSQAASFTVTGNSWSYLQFAGPADPLGIAGRDFALRFNNTGSVIDSAVLTQLTGAPYGFNLGGRYYYQYRKYHFYYSGCGWFS